MALAIAALLTLAISAVGGDQPHEVASLFINQYCLSCHDTSTAEGGIDLEPLRVKSLDPTHFDLLTDVVDVVDFEEMPPAKPSVPQPSAAERDAFLAALAQWQETLSQTNAGDPGPVLLRRLTKAEYAHSLADLTGLDLDPARRFIPDAGGGEGFTNAGDTLYMSASHLDQYLQAAVEIARHATILPGTGIQFHPHPIGDRGLEQTRNTVEQTLRMALRETALPLLRPDGEARREADYLRACWQYQHREITGQDDLKALAEESGLYPWALENWWAMLNRETRSPYLQLVLDAFWSLPAPDGDSIQPPLEVERTVARLESDLRRYYEPRRGWGRNGQSILRRQRGVSDEDSSFTFTWHLREGEDSVVLAVGDMEDGRRGDELFVRGITYNTEASMELEGPDRFLSYRHWLDEEIAKLEKKLAGQPAEDRPKADHPIWKLRRLEAVRDILLSHAVDPEEPFPIKLQPPFLLRLPAPPDALALQLPTRLDPATPDAEHATLQVWFEDGEAPDPTRLMPGTLIIFHRDTPGAHYALRWFFHEFRWVFPEDREQEANELERNLTEPGRTHFGVYYLSREQCLDLLDPQDRARLEPLFEDHRLLSPESPDEILLTEWDGALIGHLQAFARRAWRRPLMAEEKSRFRQYYEREVEAGRARESVARELLVGILASPQFLYLVESSTQGGEKPAVDEVPLTPHELAARLAATLWVSIPDEALLQLADSGALTDPEVLDREVRRMLRDEKATRLARTFGGQWLHLREFQEAANVDRELFPEFTEEVHAAMRQEIDQFLTTLIRENRPVTDLIWGDYSFLDETLAAFYGIDADWEADGFRQVNLSAHDRGGLLGMGGVLIHSSYPNRTSPVRRGHWILDVLLGDPPPAPPVDVPPLEAAANEVETPSVRAMLEAHRRDPACAGCHAKIDPLGLPMENFDAIGRWRTEDAGAPIESHAELSDGRRIEGMAGLKDYLASRRDDFLRHFSRKLLGYTLGRGVLPTDQPLLDRMVARLEGNDDRFAEAMLEIVGSRQFQHKRLDP